MNDLLSPEVPALFLNLSQRFGLLLAGGFAIMTLTSIDKLGPRRDRPWWASALLVVMFGVLGTYTGNARYAWLTAVPGFALVCTTAYAGYLQITTISLPKQLYLLAFMAGLVLFLMALVIIGAVRRWVYLLHIHKTVQDSYGDAVLEVVAE